MIEKIGVFTSLARKYALLGSSALSESTKYQAAQRIACKRLSSFDLDLEDLVFTFITPGGIGVLDSASDWLISNPKFMPIFDSRKVLKNTGVGEAMMVSFGKEDTSVFNRKSENGVILKKLGISEFEKILIKNGMSTTNAATFIMGHEMGHWLWVKMEMAKRVTNHASNYPNLKINLENLSSSIKDDNQRAFVVGLAAEEIFADFIGSLSCSKPSNVWEKVSSTRIDLKRKSKSIDLESHGMLTEGVSKDINLFFSEIKERLSEETLDKVSEAICSSIEKTLIDTSKANAIAFRR